MVFKLAQAPEKSWRRLDWPQPVAKADHRRKVHRRHRSRQPTAASRLTPDRHQHSTIAYNPQPALINAWLRSISLCAQSRARMAAPATVPRLGIAQIHAASKLVSSGLGGLAPSAKKFEKDYPSTIC